MKIKYLKKFRKKANKKYQLAFFGGNYYIRVKCFGYYPDFINCKSKDLAYKMYNFKINDCIFNLLIEKRNKYKKYKIINTK